MGSIFWRVFCGFLLTMVLGGLMSGLGIATLHHLSTDWRHDDMERRMEENIGRLILLSGQAALGVHRCGGAEAYRSFLESLRQGFGLELKVVSDDGVLASQDGLSAEERHRAGQVRRQGSTVVEKTSEGMRFAGMMSGEQGMVVLGSHLYGPPPALRPPGPAPPRMPRPLLPPFFGPGEVLRTLVTLAVLTLVCFFLARSLAEPVKRLQKAAQRFAGGDYSARVGGGFWLPGKELVALARDFDIMAERTEAVISSRTRLLRDISHELRSPLARLSVALELARRRGGAEGEAALDKIGREAARLDELIGNLLALSRLEHGGQEKRVIAVDLLLEEVAADALFEARAAGRGLRVLRSGPARVLGCRESLRRALENIVRNAVTYTAEGSDVEIALDVVDGRVEICVEDCGPGVPEADLPHLFEPFYRVAEGRERSSGGTGIGLAIAMQAVKAHGGSLGVANRHRVSGLRVTMTLPLVG